MVVTYSRPPDPGTHTKDEGPVDSGETLRDWRRRRGLTQKRLGELVGAEPQSVSAWERGTYDPRPSTVIALDEVLEAEGAVMRLYGVAVTADDLARRVADLERQVASLNVLSEQLGPQIIINGRQLATMWERLGALTRDVQRLTDPTPQSPVAPPSPA
jgi:transcriptional regulator with XRE-family HTH domain